MQTKFSKIARLLETGHSQRSIAEKLTVSRRTVSKVKEVLDSKNITSEELLQMSESDFLKFFPISKNGNDIMYHLPDYSVLVLELARKGVTMQLLWEEYAEKCKQEQLVPYQLTQFKLYFQEYLKTTEFKDIIQHRPGELVEVDWAGTKIYFTNPYASEVFSAYLFVGCLPFSQYVYAEAFFNMKEERFLTAHIHMFDYFKGSPSIIICDNLRTGVIISKGKEKRVHPKYEELANHYHANVLPTKYRKPKEKASAENSVKIATTHLIARLRNIQCSSLEEYNLKLRECLDLLNARQFTNKNGNRKETFESIESLYLQELPQYTYELCDWRESKVQANSHIAVNYVYYSIPYKWIGEKVNVKITKDMLEIHHKGSLLCTHPRIEGPKGSMVTQKEHMPPYSNSYEEWNRKRFVLWAKQIGPHTTKVVENLFDHYEIERRAYEGVRSILKLAAIYSDQRLENACCLALENTSLPRYKNIKAILVNGQDLRMKKHEEIQEEEKGCFIRGAKYFVLGETTND